MNADKPTRANRVESAVRGVLLCALLAAVAWAYVNGSGAPPVFEFSR